MYSYLLLNLNFQYVKELFLAANSYIFTAAQGQPRDGARRERATLWAIAPKARTEQNYRRKCQPSADRMDHNRACEIMERGAETGFQPVLKAKVAIPNHPFKQRINQADNRRRGQQLGAEFSSLSNAARDNGRNGRRESEQEEKLDKREALWAIAAIARRAADGGGGRHKVDELQQKVELLEMSHGALVERIEALEKL